MKLSDVGRLIRTLRYLRLTQVYHQARLRLNRIMPSSRSSEPFKGDVHLLTLVPSLIMPTSCVGNRFEFLNRSKDFGEKIDWNFTGLGLLWAYNLNYFDFLHQKDMQVREARTLIDSWASQHGPASVGSAPYPTSLRGINWIKFFSLNKLSEKCFHDLLYADYRRLARQPEFHLMGNHLLENAYSLLFASYYFKDEGFYNLAVKLLRRELTEQILNDGGHFELSPMYHQILLYRLLDCINVVSNNPWKDDSLAEFLRENAVKMLSWLVTITFKNGDIPMVNDAASGIAPTTLDLTSYAKRLGLSAYPVSLSDSGYRKIVAGKFELLVDVGQIGPDYIPGHAHSDTLNFILSVDGQAVIVDTGTSTYDRGPRRQLERMTKSHNTVTVNGEDQSEIWSAFRVGRRARIVELAESLGVLKAAHDGYKKLGVRHRRTWNWSNSHIAIHDELIGSSGRTGIASIHLHPSVVPKIFSEGFIAGPIIISASVPGTIEDYEFCDGFNMTRPAKALRFPFAGTMTTELTLI